MKEGFNFQKIANPYAIFAISWSICLLLYSFGWAGIYPRLSWELSLFLITLIALFAITSFGFNKIRTAIVSIKPGYINHKLLLSVITFLWLITFISSGVPFLTGLRDDDFGIPVVKNILTSLNNFSSVYFFYLFLNTKRKRFILYSIYCLSFYILAISRGNIMMSLMTMFFLSINIKSSIFKLKKAVLVSVIVLVILYLFGVAGNIRSIKALSDTDAKFDQSYNSEVILQIGDASESFKNSFIPNEYFWSYAYFTSPLSNLQFNINNGVPPLTFKGVNSLFRNEILIDAISTKLNAAFNLEHIMPDQVVDGLAVSTTLAGSYVDAGWIGMIIFMCFFWSFPIFYMFFITNKPLGVIGISTLCTIYFFSVFDNMYILTGLTMQLIYPLLLGYSKITFTVKSAENQVVNKILSI